MIPGRITELELFVRLFLYNVNNVLYYFKCVCFRNCSNSRDMYPNKCSEFIYYCNDPINWMRNVDYERYKDQFKKIPSVQLLNIGAEV